MKPVNTNEVAGPKAQRKVAAKPEVQPSRFRAEMPAIPGVGKGSASQLKWPSWGNIALIAVVVVLVVSGGVWWALHGKHTQPAPVAQDLATSPIPVDLPPEHTTPVHHSDEIGTVSELARPWSAKKFSYSNPDTQEEVPAIAIRLPGGNGHTSASYWVILLKAPYGQCELEYVTDVKQIASKFGYNATHPMVADACSATLYDPLQTGTLPNGSWARGEIVHGTGFRPPLQVEMRVEGDRLIYGRAED